MKKIDRRARVVCHRASEMVFTLVLDSLRLLGRRGYEPRVELGG